MIELVNIFINNIAPVLIVAGVGYLAGRRFKIESASLAKLIFNVFSPALVFYSLYTNQIEGHEFGLLFLMIVLYQLGVAALSYLVLTLRGVPKVQRASVMLGSFSMNTGNFGLSVVSFAFGEAVLARAVVIYISNTIMNYTFGVFVASSGSRPPHKALLNVLRVPAFYATVIAFLLLGFHVALPEPIFRSVTVLKDAAIPSMLVLLGLQMSQSLRVSRPALVSTGVLLKLAVAPLVGLGLALLFQLDNLSATALIMQTSMPAAVLTLILAKEYKLDEALSLNLIMVSTLVSPFTLSVIILLLQKTFMAM